MPWYTGTQLQADVLQILKQTALEDFWPPLCDAAAATAYSDLTEILLGKGYSIAQLNAWDNRATYSRQQALFWLYTETSIGLNYDDKEISKLDRRKGLMDATTIMINGIPVAPDGEDSAGGIGGGLISEDGYRITGSTEW